MGPGGAEVVVRPEGLVERGDEVEQSLPADLVTQRVFTVLAALPQPTKQTQWSASLKYSLLLSLISADVTELDCCAY